MKYFQEMSNLLSYIDFINEGINDKLSVKHTSLLRSIKAVEVDLTSEFNLTSVIPNELESFYEYIDLHNFLLKYGYKLGSVYDVKDYETFSKDPIKFCFLYDYLATDLDEPEYIFIEIPNKEIKCYKASKPIVNFYDRLCSRDITITKDGVEYEYITSNGTEWTLTTENETELFIPYLIKDDMEKLLLIPDLEVNLDS
jgi:hypothetical protein